MRLRVVGPYSQIAGLFRCRDSKLLQLGSPDDHAKMEV